MFNKSYFEKVFKHNDPWGYAASEYEQVKYKRQIDAINTYAPNPENVLEIGCAEGLFTEKLAQTYPDASIISLDISPTAIERAKKTCNCYGKVTCIEADILQYWKQGQLVPDTYDLIIQSESLFFLLPNLLKSRGLSRYFDDIIRALRPGGIFLTAHGLSVGTEVVMSLYYRVLERVSNPVYKTKFREWNDFRNKYFTYDLRVFQRL